DLQALRAAHVEAEALLVDVCVVEIARRVQIDLQTLRRGRARQAAALIFRPLDLDDLGAERTKPARRPRPGPHPGKVHHADVFESARPSHGVILLQPGTDRPSPVEAAATPRPLDWQL